MKMRFIEDTWDEGPDFELFHESLGSRVYKKITGKSGDDMTKWSELRKTMIAFGQGDSPRLKKLAKEGLSGLGHFSSGEEFVAVALLLIADRGSEAQEIANRIGWLANWDRTADMSTRQLVGKLMTM